MLVVETSDIEKLHKVIMEIDQGRAIPYAAQQSLNTSAFRARTVWAIEGRKQMTVRQPKTVSKAAAGWTFGGRHHKVVKARLRKSISQMQSQAGNTLRYMAEQEHGVRKLRGKGL